MKDPHVINWRHAASSLSSMRREEWDWPPTRGRYRIYSRFDVYQPSGWNSPGVKKAVHIYWRVMVAIFKVMFAIPLTIMAIGAFWLLWTIVTVALLHY
jgi:hypothetical protein